MAHLVQGTDGGLGRRPEAALVLQALLQVHQPQVGRGVVEGRHARLLLQEL